MVTKKTYFFFFLKREDLDDDAGLSWISMVD